MIKTKLAALGLVAVLSIGSTSALAASPAKAGTKCTKAGQTQVVKNKKYTCIKLGSSLYWNNGVKVITQQSSPTPQPSPTASPKVVNDFRGLLFRQDKTGTVFLSTLWREIASGDYFLGSDLSKWTTPFNQNFNEQDVWQNSVLGCPSGSGCLQSTYVVKQNGTTATEISFASLPHPGTFAAPMLKEADFGQTENIVVAHIKFNAIDGASDVIVRYDTVTKSMTPIFVTYCKSSSTRICSYGASISGLRVAHKSGNVYFVLNLGTLDVNNSAADQFLVSLPINSPSQVIKSSAEIGNRLWDGDIQKQFIYEHTDELTTIDDVGVSLSEEYIFLITRGKTNVSTNNGYCRVNPITRSSSCAQVEPFQFISSIINVDDDSFVYDGLSGIKYFDIPTGKSSPIYNTSLSTWLLDLTK
jgi:hypothetical protein